MNAQQARKLIQFGIFELDTQTGELRKGGVKVKLQSKPFQILNALIERPGEVVTREELKQRLWPGDTFVDFESGLNTAANRLRLTLGDSAETPRYVETLARSGYRFIAPVEEIEAPPMQFTAPAEAPAPPSAIEPAPLAEPPSPWADLTRRGLVQAACAFVGGAAAASSFFLFRASSAPQPEIRQVTFRRGMMHSARFAPDGQTIVYSAQWDAQPEQLFLADPVSPESRSIGFQKMKLASVSRTGELALLSSNQSTPFSPGNLSRVPMHGGSPMPVSNEVLSAAWSADGSQISVLRFGSQYSSLEYPLGKVLYRSPGWLSDARVSPHGDRVAFLEHPLRGDDAGVVMMVDLNGNAKQLSRGWISSEGLAWAPSGKEIWFTACQSGIARSVWAVTPEGKLRPVAKALGTLVLQDISPSGRVLVKRDTMRSSMVVSTGEVDRDLSWFDWTRPIDLSPDGRSVLFDESGEGGGPHYAVYVRRLDDDSTMRLAEGRAMGFSPDGKWALTLGQEGQEELLLVPVGPGEPRKIPGQGLQYQWARYFPDGKRLLAAGSERGKNLQLYVQPLDGGKPKPLTAEFFLRTAAISPDGKRLAGLNNDGKLVVCDVDSGATRAVPTPEPLFPIQWSQDGEWLYARQAGLVPTRISRLHLASGKLEPWKEISPRDPAGVGTVNRVLLTHDGKTAVYSFVRVLSELYVVEGWK